MWHHDLLGALGGHRAPLRPVSPSEQSASSRETEPTPAAPARASPAGAARSPPSSSGRSSVRAAATPRPWPPPPHSSILRITVSRVQKCPENQS